MKKLLTAFMLVMFLFCELYSQEKTPAIVEDSQSKEETIANAEKKEKKDYSAEFWVYGSVPVVVVAWGIGAWGWGTASKPHFENDGWGLEQCSYTGGSDKIGHTWGIYVISRVGSYAFEKSGDSRLRAGLKGLLYGQLMGLGIEIGDSFGDTYGFAWGDMVWNLGGGLFALALDLYPPLDDLLGFQLEYLPSVDHRERPDKWIEFTSDVSGQKFILALKLRGIPYLRDTFMQYFQVDFGYYTKGYWYDDSNYKFRSRHAYIGFSFNLSRVCESFIPKGKTRSALSTFFKYYHAPLGYNPDVLDYTLPGRRRNVPKAIKNAYPFLDLDDGIPER